MLVVLVQRIFAHYRKPIYDDLAQRVDFRLVHGKMRSTVAQATAPYAHAVGLWRYGAKDTQVFIGCFWAILKLKPDVVIHEFAVGILSLPMVLALARIMGFKFILHGHGYDRRKGFDPGNRLLDKYRLWLIRKADAIIVYGKCDAETLKEHTSSARIFVAPNTIDTPRLIAIRTQLEREGRTSLRRRLGFESGYHLIFLGRLLEEKHPEMILEEFESLSKRVDKPVHIHFVGDGPMEEALRNTSMMLSTERNVHFHGGIYDGKKTGELLYASDLMVVPGYLGLSINHAFCFDCPVITFAQGEQGPFHSPEIEYLIDGETGILVKRRTRGSLAEAIASFLVDNESRQLMAKNIRRLVADECSKERMVDGILSAIRFVFNSDRLAM